MLAINKDRVLADLRALPNSARPEPASIARPFSDADIEARRWLMAQMQSPASKR